MIENNLDGMFTNEDATCNIQETGNRTSKKKKKTAPWPSISHLPREQDLKSIAGEVKMNLSVTFCCGHKNMKTVALVTH